MADVAQSSTDGGASRFLARLDRKLQSLHSPVTRYGLAAVSVALALGLSLALQYYQFRGAPVPVLCFAIAITSWYAGNGPAVAAIVFCSLSFAYFFTEPYYSFRIASADLPYFFIYVTWAVTVASFASVRRRVEQGLRQAQAQLAKRAVDLQEARDSLEREVEQRTQQARLLDLTHDCIFVRDMNDVITYWNRGAEELYGWSAQHTVGKKSHEVLHTVVPEASAKAFEALLATDRWEGELIETRADGTQVVVSSRWSLQRDDQGRPVAVLATKNDITARKRREEEIVALNRELVKHAEDLAAANKELESFAYSVSHDLRAPLRHVIGYAELLQKQATSSLDEKSQRYMKTILESAKRMGALIDDLLGFSRIGRADTNKTTVDLAQLVHEAIAEVRPQIGDRAIAWNVGALPPCHGDRAMLKVALVNLISNAVKFSRQQAQAEIAIGSIERQHDQIEVFIRDNGAGFDMRHADKLFGVFQRLHRSEEFEGTGIGLATVQRIIHRHGGNIRAEGGVDQGATFYFSLPRA